MVEPKKVERSLADVKFPVQHCANPLCGHKLPMRTAHERRKTYCDKVCRNEHLHIKGMEQRPAELRCAFCNKLINTEKLSPAMIERSYLHFCDPICTDGYRRKKGLYKSVSREGGAAIKEYKKKHGHAPGYKRRSAAVSANNTKAPPKSKNFDRQGKVWGYDVIFRGTGQDYIVTVPELPEIAEFHSKTVKAGLLEIRKKIPNLRIEQRKAEGNHVAE